MDSGRGLAALIVLEHHVMVFFGNRISAALGADSYALRFMNFVSSLNDAAVQFFFFLSGWAIFIALDNAREADGNINWYVFAWHRCRRILPLYWLALAFSWIMFIPSGGWQASHGLPNLLGNLLFLQTPLVSNGWFTPYAGNGPLWSLAFEAWYYAATPFLCFTVATMGGVSVRWAILAMLLSVLAALSSVVLNRIWFTPIAAYVAMWPIWVAGFVFAAMRSKGLNDRIFLLIMIVFSVGIIILSSAVNSDSLHSLRNGMSVVTISIVFLIIQSLPGSLIGKQYGSVLIRIFVALGSGSYTIYIFHYPLLSWLSANEAGGDMVVASLLVLIIFSPRIESGLLRSIRRISSPHAALKTIDSTKKPGRT